MSILIPSYEHLEELAQCLDSIFSKTTYDNYEIIIVENNSRSPEVFAYYEKARRKHAGFESLLRPQRLSPPVRRCRRYKQHPVERGVGAITNHPISESIARIVAKEPEARWLCTNATAIEANFAMANGARVLNATNFYPDAGKWAILDPCGDYFEQTNRYANQRVELTEEKSSFESPFPDALTWHLNPESLKDLDVRYLFSPLDQSKLLARHGIGCEKVASQDGYAIWHLRW